MNATDTRYNGWTNYETWVVKLWIDNEQPTYEYWREQTRFALSDEGYEAHRARFFALEKDDVPKQALAEQLKEHFEEAVPELQGCWADLMNAALGAVDWHEIAVNMIDAARE